jgi:site-specific recombinase XerD
MSTNQQTIIEAIDAFVTSQHDVQQKTRDNHRYRLNAFRDHCEERGIETVDEVEGYHIEQYKTARREEDGWALATLKNHCWTINKWLSWCESVGFAGDGASEAVIVPDVSSEEEARDTFIVHERAREIIDYLASYQFASLAHIVFHTLYHTGMRRSGAIALDVGDWNSETQSLSLRHRPAEGTRLKSGDAAERDIAVTDGELASALDSWVAERRPDALDDAGRKPLLTSGKGRLHGQTVTKICYRITRPCWRGQPCPHDKDPETCEYTNAERHSSCPSAVSAQPVRRSAITNHLRENVSKEIVSERMSVSQEVLDTHYDERTLEQKRETRASRLSNKNV